MRALSLLQPWASLVGPLKPIETRGRNVGLKIGERFCVHASKGVPRAGTEDFAARQAACRAAYGPDGIRIAFSFGGIVSTATCVDARISEGFIPFDWHERCGGPEALPRVMALGNFERGRVLYLLDDVVTLLVPVAARGSLGMWQVPPEVLRMVEWRAP